MDHNKERELFSPQRRVILPRLNASVLLLLSAVVAVILANSPWAVHYFSFLKHPIELKILGYEVFVHHGETMTLSQFVNDALMAVFFFVVGLEIKQEMIVGELSTLKKSILPVIAAFGGMVVPVLLFFAVCHEYPASRGAAIPMATDIAFALALISALGSRVPSSLRIFLMALAVVDDIGGIIIIALFYSSHIAWVPLLIALGVLGLIYIFGKLGVENSMFYMLMFFVVWTLFLHSGLHATISGVLVALAIPLATKVRIEELGDMLYRQFESLSKEEHKIGRKGAVVLSRDQLHVTERLKATLGYSVSPVQTLEHSLSPIVSFIILPLFAFVNAGVTFGEINQIMGVPVAIFLGLFPGKAIGITFFTWLAVKFKVSSWPSGMNLRNLIPLSIFGGIGFTVSLFIATLSYNDQQLLNQAKLGIFAGTIISAVLGYVWLNHVLPQLTKKDNEASAPREAH